MFSSLQVSAVSKISAVSKSPEIIAVVTSLSIDIGSRYVSPQQQASYNNLAIDIGSRSVSPQQQASHNASPTIASEVQAANDQESTAWPRPTLDRAAIDRYRRRMKFRFRAYLP
jgi:hypothetical protein